MQKLFSAGKINLILDGYSPGIEKRRGEDVKIVTLSLRAESFDAALAASIDDGLGGDSNVKASLFNMTTAEPKPHLDSVKLSLGCPRQTLLIFPAPDVAEPRLALTQGKVSDTAAKRQKDGDGYEFAFKIAVGPVGREDLEFLQHWYKNSQFVTFEESEPGIFDEEPEPKAAAAPVDGRSPAIPFDDGATPQEATPESDEAREVGSRPTAKRGRKKAGKHDPDRERAAQVTLGKRKGGKPNGAAHA